MEATDETQFTSIKKEPENDGFREIVQSLPGTSDDTQFTSIKKELEDDGFREIVQSLPGTSGSKRSRDSDNDLRSDDLPLKKVCPETNRPATSPATLSPTTTSTIVQPTTSPAIVSPLTSTPTILQISTAPGQTLQPTKTPQPTTQQTTTPLQTSKPTTNPQPTTQQTPQPTTTTHHVTSPPLTFTPAPPSTSFSVITEAFGFVDLLKSIDTVPVHQQLVDSILAVNTRCEKIEKNQEAQMAMLNGISEKLVSLETNMVKLTTLLVTIHSSGASAPRNTSNAIYTDNNDGTVTIGDENFATIVGKFEMDSTFARSTNGKDYVLKLMSLCFLDDELAASNYCGGRTVCGSEIKFKRALNENSKFKAILYQAEKDFPHTTGGRYLKALKDSVNSKCRKIDVKLRAGNV